MYLKTFIYFEIQCKIYSLFLDIVYKCTSNISEHIAHVIGINNKCLQAMFFGFNEYDFLSIYIILFLED